jgi:hypothetical protein
MRGSDGGGVRIGGALGSGAAGAGGAWPRWLAAVSLIVSPARLRRARPRPVACRRPPETLQARTRAPGAYRSGHAGWGVASVCTIVEAHRPSCQERAVLHRGRPPTRGGDERWAVHRARRLQGTRLGCALSCADTNAQVSP